MSAKLPPKLKELRGTDQPCRRSEGIDHVPIDHVPDPPKWLSNPHAIDEWNRVAPLLQKLGLLTHAGLSTLGVMCAQFGVIASASESGDEIVASAISGYRGLANDFGLTPVGATRVKPKEPEKINRFADRGKLRSVS
jgi:phage terminase small subunit